jgi:hypothetical protein
MRLRSVALGMSLATLATATACKPRPAQPLYPAGSNHDEGHGMLARASSKMMTSDEADAPLVPERRARVGDDDEYEDGADYGGATYGGSAYGIPDGAFGGASYAAYTVPPWPYPSVNRMPSYSYRQDLRGAIEGTISWRGATPTLTTTCGAITPVRTGPASSLAGAVVYLENVTAGRTPMHALGDMRPITVGGVIVKRGCSFAPSAQLVTPVPAQVTIHGDRKPTKVVAWMPQGTKRASELQEGGRIALPMKAGTLKIESEDGTLGAAFVLGLETPAYTVTDETGRFRLDELAPGTYQLVAWFPPVPALVKGRLVYGEPIMVKRSVRVDGHRTARLDLALGTK